MRTRRVFACLVMLGIFVFGATSEAAASGGAAYQIALSDNCNNPSVAACAPPPASFGLGGDWGSVRLNSDGSGTAEFTTANHRTPGVPSGATHVFFVLVWAKYSSLTPPADAVFPDPNGQYLVITVVNVPNGGSLTAPATPGHYEFQGARFGMPGVNYMLQINAI